MFKKIVLFTIEVIKMVVISLAIVIPIRYFIIQPFYVKGMSMEPNLQDHEYLIIDEISYRFRPINRGDIIVFRYPLNPQEYFIKRVIALPGESVQIKDAQVIIYNEENPGGLILNEEYISPDIPTYSDNSAKLDLGEKEYYVLGDNRLASRDSRVFGALNRSYIIGRAFLRGWPFERFTVFEKKLDYSQF